MNFKNLLTHHTIHNSAKAKSQWSHRSEEVRVHPVTWEPESLSTLECGVGRTPGSPLDKTSDLFKLQWQSSNIVEILRCILPFVFLNAESMSEGYTQLTLSIPLSHPTPALHYCPLYQHPSRTLSVKRLCQSPQLVAASSGKVVRLPALEDQLHHLMTCDFCRCTCFSVKRDY